MGFWENFWLFVPPLTLVVVGVIFYLKTGSSGSTGSSDNSGGSQ